MVHRTLFHNQLKCTNIKIKSINYLRKNCLCYFSKQFFPSICISIAQIVVFFIRQIRKIIKSKISTEMRELFSTVPVI